MPVRSTTVRMFWSAPAALATSLVVLAGVAACAEMDAQDAAHVNKANPAREPAPFEQAMPNASADTTSKAPADALIDLKTALSASPTYQMKASGELPVAPAIEGEPGVNAWDMSPRVLEVVTNVVAATPVMLYESSTSENQWSLVAVGPDSAAWSVLGGAAPATTTTSVANAPAMQMVQFTVVVAAPVVNNTEAASVPAGLHEIEQPAISTLDDFPMNVAELEPAKPTERASSGASEPSMPSTAARGAPAGGIDAVEPSDVSHDDAPEVQPVLQVAAKTNAQPIVPEETIHAPMPVRVSQPVQAFHEVTGAPFTPPMCTTQAPAALGAVSVASASSPRSSVPSAAPPSAQVPFPGQRALSIPTSTAGIAFLAAIVLAILATLGIARTLSKGVGADGVIRFAPNTGSKMVLGMGAMATLMLGASWLACWEVNLVAASGAGSVAPAYVRIACLAFGSVGVCVILGVALVRGVALPSVRLLENMKRMGAGDLTVAPINSTARDELGELSRAADKLLAAVRDVVTEVSITSTEVAAAAGEIAAGAQGMSVAAGRVSDQCARAANDAAGAGRLAEHGGRSIEQAGSEISRVDEMMREGAASVASLSGRGRQIARVVELVSDLSDRTHLVALNASIEAAKAGPNGRAFAVLADEVRRLAERAQKATEEAAATIQGVQDEALAATDRMAKGVVQIKQSAEVNGRAGEDVRRIVEAASGVAGTIKTMGNSAEEAGAGAAQSAGAAVQLSTRAEDLKAVLGRFRMDTSGVMKHGAKAA